jgi:hypothetical protein
MALTIDNFAKSVPAELLKKATKLKIRECEEVEKGKYVAFAEDGSQDFDVSITISGKEKITDHSCDCQEKLPLCSHKIALLQFITSKKQAKTKSIKPSGKLKVSDVLLEETPGDEIKIWLQDLFVKKKDLEMLFVSRFSNSTQTFTLEEVDKITLDVIKTVIKSRRIIEKTEGKTIAEMWKEVHKPIIEYYYAKPSGEPNFDAFLRIQELCLGLNLELRKNDTEIIKYRNQVLKSAEKMLLDLKSEDDWNESSKLFVQQLSKEKSECRYIFLESCLNLYRNCPEARKSNFLKEIMIAFQKHEKMIMQKDRDFQLQILPRLSTDDGTFQTYFLNFESMIFQPKFNHELIQKLIDIQQWGRAEKFCETEIKNNVNDAYNAAYFGFLKTIHTATGNEKKLALLFEKSVPSTFSFEDYQVCMKSFQTDEKRKDFRKKMLSKVGHSMDPNAKKFHFALYFQEENYDKMLSLINVHTPYEIVLMYWDNLRESSPSDFLRIVLRVANSDIGYREEENVKKFYPILLDKLLQNYDQATIRGAINAESKIWRVFPFVEYVKKHLQG